MPKHLTERRWWPPLGRSHGHQRAVFMSATGQFLLAIDSPARESPVVHPADPPHRRPRPDRLLGPAARPAFTDRLALGTRLGRPLGHRHHPLTTRPHKPRGNTPTVEEPDRPANPPRPPRKRRLTTQKKAMNAHQKSPSVDQGSGSRSGRLEDRWPAR